MNHLWKPCRITAMYFWVVKLTLLKSMAKPHYDYKGITDRVQTESGATNVVIFMEDRGKKSSIKRLSRNRMLCCLKRASQTCSKLSQRLRITSNPRYNFKPHRIIPWADQNVFITNVIFFRSPSPYSLYC